MNRLSGWRFPAAADLGIESELNNQHATGEPAARRPGFGTEVCSGPCPGMMASYGSRKRGVVASSVEKGIEQVMQPEDFWKEYVGEISPGEFVGTEPVTSVEDLHRRVERYVNQIPTCFGIALRGTWKKTWSDYSYTREEVADGLICHLEASGVPRNLALKETAAPSEAPVRAVDPPAPAEPDQESLG